MTNNRVRSYGIHIGILPAGKFNAVTDVPGVKVGRKHNRFFVRIRGCQKNRRDRSFSSWQNRCLGCWLSVPSVQVLPLLWELS